MNTESSRSAEAPEVVWACVEDGFYIATCSNTFLGFVDRIESELFQVCDARTEQVGLFTTLEAAQGCLLQRVRLDDGLSQNGNASP